MNTYRFCDNVWTFVLNEVDFKDSQDTTRADKVKIVACDGKGECNSNPAGNGFELPYSNNFSRTGCPGDLRVATD